MPDLETVNFAVVALDAGIDQFLDYSVPAGWSVAPGMRVEVPVRKTPRIGTIVGLKEVSSVANVLPIQALLSEKPLISEELFQLVRWMARYYCCPMRKVIKLILPPPIRDGMKHKEQLFITSLLSANALVPLAEKLRASSLAQAQIIDVLLKSPKGILLSELLEKAEVSVSSLTALIKKNVLEKQKIQIERTPFLAQDYFRTKSKKLNSEQQEALDQIRTSLTSNTFETRLIYGVTGSGKTEIYLQAITHALSLNKGVIFLVPEIALTSQTVERLRSRFEEKIALLHHRLSDGERRDAWHQIQSGKAPIVIGARSAIFSPVPNLGLIIVDEEQESSYKQTGESPSYHARDVAVVRGKLCRATVLLGSATPSFETFHNAQNGKYTLSTLKKRADHATLPEVHTVDMTQEKTKGFTLFSERLIDGIKERITLGEQVILFLNRRGYHTSQMCSLCAHVIKCPECDLSLTFHLSDNILACHLCDYRLRPPRACPHCKQEGSLKFKGAGTEMVERSLHALLPEVRTLRLDADTTRHKGTHELIFKQFKAGKADVLIGTQMIAKGLHFPSVTLVGILNADTSLQIPDFRASEHVFQLITQVAGRSGRGALKGEVIIQTRMPDHPVILLAAAQDYDTFYHQEIAVRQAFTYPPFSHLIKCVFSGKDEGHTLRQARLLRDEIIFSLPSSYQILPLVPAGHAKVKGEYHFQFLIKGETTGHVVRVLESLFETKKGRKVDFYIDVDPLSTFF